MSLSKKALLIGIGSTIAVGGVTTAIAVPLSQQTTIEQQKPGIKPSVITPAKQLADLVKEIKAEDIVVLNKQANASTVNMVRKNGSNQDTKLTEVDKAKTYAFNLETTQFVLKEEARNKFPKEVQFKFELEQQNNLSSALNNGMIKPTIKAMVGQTEVGNTTVELTNFKKANEQVVKVLKNETNKLVLDLVSENNTTYRTIEDLNQETQMGGSPTVKVSGLNTVLKAVAEEDASKVLKDWSVLGNIKLDHIDATETQAIFYLAKTSSVSGLKLIKDQGKDTQEEVLIDQVKIANVLASSVNTSLVGIDEKENEAYIKEFAEKAVTAGYKKEGDNPVTLEVKESGSSSSVISTLEVKPSLLEKTIKDQMIKGHLLVSFGSGNEAKTYDSNKDEDLAELNKASFWFNVYVKKFDGSADDEKVAKEATITAGAMLDKYFDKDSFTKPVDPTTLEMGQERAKIPLGGFTEIDVAAGKLMKEVNLGMASMSKQQTPPPQAADTNEEVPSSENWISFVSYTYKNPSLNKKVLFTKYLDIFRLDVKQPTKPTASADHSK